MDKAKINISLMKRISPGKTGKIADTEITGFQVWIRKNSVAFMFDKKVDGRHNVMKIGPWPGMMPDEARTKALELLGAIANHEDVHAPSARRDPLLKDAMNAYAETAGSDYFKRDTRYCFKNYAHLAEKRIVDVSEADILAVHKSLANHPTTANHCVKRLATAIDRLANQMNIRLPNPAREVKPYPERPRQRFLTGDEAPKLINALELMRVHDQYRTSAEALLMMIFTGQRKSNVLAMNLRDIRDGIWVIPGDQAKAGRDIVVPLNKYALEVLERRQQKAAKGGWLFPARDGDTRKPHLQEVRGTFDVACKKAGLENCHPHDLRRTLGSWMLMSGATIAEVSRTLGHSSIKVTEQVYAHLLPGKISEATQTAIDAMTGRLNSKEE